MPPSAYLSVGQGHPSSSSRPANAKSYHPREASGGVFNLFTPVQIKQFKEAFSMIDVDGDGKIGVEDLRGTFENLGIPISNSEIQALLSSRPGQANPSLSHATIPSPDSPDSLSFPSSSGDTINFTQFLTLFGERLCDLDAEEELVEAFRGFEDLGVGGDGKVDVQELRGWLGSYGDKMSDAEIDRFLNGPFLDRRGKTFDYAAFASSLKVNEAPPPGEAGLLSL